MNCPTCGNFIPDGAPACPNCGTVAAPNYSQPQAYGSPYYNPGMVTPKKSNKGLIIGLAIGGVVLFIAILSVIVAIATPSILNTKRNGTYVCNDYGMTMTLKVNGEKFTLTSKYDGESEKTNGKIKFDGDTVKLTAKGETIKGKYNSEKKTITIEGMKFKKK